MVHEKCLAEHWFRAPVLLVTSACMIPVGGTWGSPAFAGGRVAVIDNALGQAQGWCDLLVTNHYECTVLPETGPVGGIELYDVVIDLSTTWSDAGGLLADHLRSGRGVITVGGAPIALGIESDATVQAWIGANATATVSWASLITTDKDELLGSLSIGSYVGGCGQFEFCPALSDTTGHLNARPLARFGGGEGRTGILRNEWQGGQSVYLSGVSYGGPPGALVIFRAVGLLSTFPQGCFDFDEDGILDLCCFLSSKPVRADVPSASGTLLPLKNNRYLSFTAGDPGRMQAIRVRISSLPAPFDIWNGATMWLGPPRLVSEHGGSVNPVPGFANFTAATLTCEPAYADWGSRGTIHVFHEAIVPGGDYSIDVLDESCSLVFGFSDPIFYANRVTWGDTVGRFDAAQQRWTAADDGVDVTDVVAVVQKFVSSPDAPMKVRCDLEPSCPDGIINISDALFVISGFQGLPYPFTPSAADPCDSICFNPLL